MEFLLNAQDYNCYTNDIPTVAPQNFIKFLHQRVEVSRLLVIMHFYVLLWFVIFLLQGGLLILASSVCVLKQSVRIEK